MGRSCSTSQIGWLTPLGTDPAGLPRQRLDRRYKHDALGNITSASAGTSSNGTVVSYQYDTEANRLDAVTTATTVTNEVCTQPVDPTCQYIHGRLVCPAPTCIPTTSTSTQTNQLTYDAAENLLSDGTRTYSWNAANQLASVTIGSTTYQYTYDGLGRRVGVAATASTTTVSPMKPRT